MEKQVFHKCLVSSNFIQTKVHCICWGFLDIHFFPDVENVDMKKGNVSVPPVCTKRDKILQGPSPQGLWQNFCWNIFWGNKERNTCFILSSHISSWSEINNDIVHQNALAIIRSIRFCCLDSRFCMVCTTRRYISVCLESSVWRSFKDRVKVCQKSKCVTRLSIRGYVAQQHNCCQIRSCKLD